MNHEIDLGTWNIASERNELTLALRFLANAAKTYGPLLAKEHNGPQGLAWALSLVQVASGVNVQFQLTLSSGALTITSTVRCHTNLRVDVESSFFLLSLA